MFLVRRFGPNSFMILEGGIVRTVRPHMKGKITNHNIQKDAYDKKPLIIFLSLDEGILRTVRPYMERKKTNHIFMTLIYF